MGLTQYEAMSLGLGGLGMIANQVIGMAQQKQQNKFTAEEAEKAYQREQEMINQQNTYNSPENQMKLYQEAGLNPNLIYGKVGGITQTSHASYTPAQKGVYSGQLNLADILNTLLGFEKLKQEKVATVRLQQMTAFENNMQLIEEWNKKFQMYTDWGWLGTEDQTPLGEKSLIDMIRPQEVTHEGKPTKFGIELKNREYMQANFPKLLKNIDEKNKSATEQAEWERIKRYVWRVTGVNIDSAKGWESFASKWLSQVLDAMGKSENLEYK